MTVLTIVRRTLTPTRSKRTKVAPPTPRRPIVTRAERAECTCPEACERDHERDEATVWPRRAVGAGPVRPKRSRPMR
jgi:hypothetical protein